MSNTNPVKKFKKGETGNPNGRPKKEDSLTEVMRTYLQEIPEGQTRTRKELFVDKSFQKASEGDPTFAKLVWNYIDGMPKQAVDVTSGGEKLSTVLMVKPEKLPEEE